MLISDELNKKIKFFQITLSLIRDLVLSVVVLLTITIIYFGGDPSKLNALDWGKLVGSAFLIVLGPIVVFFVFKVIFETLQFISYLPRGLLIPGNPVPRGIYAWLCLNVARLSKKEYISYFRKYQQELKKYSIKYPILFRVTINTLDIYEKFYYSKTKNKIDLYMVAIFALIIAGVIFKETLSNYVP